MLIRQTVGGAQRQRIETKNLSAVNQIAGLQRDITRLPLTVIVNPICRQRAAALTQPFPLIAGRPRNRQR
ncbi:hypothetical protein, partial [Pectobacterium brasiliense]